MDQTAADNRLPLFMWVDFPVEALDGEKYTKQGPVAV